MKAGNEMENDEKQKIFRNFRISEWHKVELMWRFNVYVVHKAQRYVYFCFATSRLLKRWKDFWEVLRHTQILKDANCKQKWYGSISHVNGFGGLEVACWPLVPKIAGSHPAEAVGFLVRKKKILSTPSFGGEVKPSVPCRSFTACERSLNVTCKSAFRQNSRTCLAHSSNFRRWVLSRGDTHEEAWWRKLEGLTQIAQ